MRFRLVARAVTSTVLPLRSLGDPEQQSVRGLSLPSPDVLEWADVGHAPPIVGHAPPSQLIQIPAAFETSRSRAGVREEDKYDRGVVRTRMREIRTDLWVPAATQALIGWLLLVVVLLLGARPVGWLLCAAAVLVLLLALLTALLRRVANERALAYERCVLAFASIMLEWPVLAAATLIVLSFAGVGHWE
jgi:hypothetical protein